MFNPCWYITLTSIKSRPSRFSRDATTAWKKLVVSNVTAILSFATNGLFLQMTHQKSLFCVAGINSLSVNYQFLSSFFSIINLMWIATFPWSLASKTVNTCKKIAAIFQCVSLLILHRLDSLHDQGSQSNQYCCTIFCILQRIATCKYCQCQRTLNT